MALNWDGRHARAGIFKLNVHLTNAGAEFMGRTAKPEWIWEVSVPGICLASNWRGEAPTHSEEEAKAAAERWLLGQVGEILLGLNIPLEQQTPITMRLQTLALQGRADGQAG